MSWVTLAALLATVGNLTAAVHYARKAARINRRIAQLNAIESSLPRGQRDRNRPVVALTTGLAGPGDRHV